MFLKKKTKNKQRSPVSFLHFVRQNSRDQNDIADELHSPAHHLVQEE